MAVIYKTAESGSVMGMGIDWNDRDMLELIDALISNPRNVSKYSSFSEYDKMADAINSDYPELDISEQDIPRVILMVKDKYRNGWI